MFEPIVRYTLRERTNTFPYINTPLRKFNETHERIINKLITNAHAVPTNHPLVSLVHSFNVPKTMNKEVKESFYEKNIPIWCASRGIYTSINEGMVFNDLFFEGKNVLVLDKSYSFTSHKDLNKREYESPLRFWRVPLGTNPMVYPDGSSSSLTSDDITVASINVERLISLYIKWREDQDDMEGQTENIPQFISQYVLTSSMRSIADAAFINIGLQYLKMGLNVVNPYEGDYASWFEIEDLIPPYQDALNEMKKKSLDMDQVISDYPLARKESMSDWLPILIDKYTSANAVPMSLMSIPTLMVIDELINNPAGKSDFLSMIRHIKRKFNSHSLTKNNDLEIIGLTKKEVDEL